MNITILLSGLIGAIVSAVALYVFFEISTAYWAPERAGKRWKALINLPKLNYFAPTFRWLMPLLAIFVLFQFFISMQILFSGAGQA